MNPNCAKLGWLMVSRASFAIRFLGFMSSFTKTNKIKCFQLGVHLHWAFPYWAAFLFLHWCTYHITVMCFPTTCIFAMLLIYIVFPYPVPLVSNHPGPSGHIHPIWGFFNSLHHAVKAVSVLFQPIVYICSSTHTLSATSIAHLSSICLHLSHLSILSIYS